MLRFRDLRVTVKLAIGFGSVSACLLAVGAVAYAGSRTLVSQLGVVHTTRLPSMSVLLEADRDLQQMLVAERTLIAAEPGSEVFRDAEAAFEENLGQSDERWTRYKELAVTPEERELIPRYEQARRAWEPVARRVVKLCHEATPESRAAALELSLGEAGVAFEAMRDQIDRLTGVIDELADRDRRTADAAAARSRNLTIGSIAAGLLAAIVLGVVVARGVTRPLAQMVDRIRDISEGEGDLTKRVDVRSHDEFGHLADLFNGFLGKLRDLIAEVAGATEDVAGAATQIAASAEEISRGVKQQDASTERAAGALTEMSASIEDVAAQSTEASLAADRAGERADEGGRVVGQTVESIRHLESVMQGASAAIDALGERADGVGRIIDVIRDIADQTNLLALNAAIEAARAGEHGRGFAVVADEVRKLSERTTRATEEVAESIRAIQEDTKTAVQRMSGGVQAVAEGVERAESAGAALAQINEAAVAVRERIGSIAAAAQEQSAASTEISETVTTISSLVRESSSQTDQAAGAAAHLSARAEQLRALIGRFRI